MRRICLALIAGVMAAGAAAGAAAAEAPAPSTPTTQTAGQVATSGQYADSSATSTQVAPKNTNVNVRVLSPGANGPVTQTNSSTAGALAANANVTNQSAEQTGAASQQAGQQATNLQGASAVAESTQVKPENTNVDVRVLSPGDNGSVAQSNTSSATALAANLNTTDQELTQASDDPALQSAGQTALSTQGASAEAESTQIAPKNTNVGVRVLSPGNDGAVSQRNDSSATAIALNGNSTEQDIDQQAGVGGGSTGQAAAQIAGNVQGAGASANSVQIAPSNTNADVRVLSPGHGGDVTQANTSRAVGVALNGNHTTQSIEQALEGEDACCWRDHEGNVAIQAAGQVAGNVQSASVCCAASVQVHPENTNLAGGDPNSGTRQENESTALGVAANLNRLDQGIVQGPADDEQAEPLLAATHGELTEVLPKTIVAPRAGTEQSNESNATSLALNLNKTEQTIAQQQESRPADVGVQAAGQMAGNEQHADSAAASIQYAPQNRNGALSGSLGDGCRERCAPTPHGDDGLVPIPCKRSRCTPDPCGHDRCQPNPCEWKRWTGDPCREPRWCSRGCEKRTSTPPQAHTAGSEVGPLAG
jgi:hypothetical protein